MSDELQMTDAVRMERAIIRIALLLAPDDAMVGVNFDELPQKVQALVSERDRLRAAMVPMLGAFKALEMYLAAVRAGEAPAEGAMAVIAAGVDMMRRAEEQGASSFDPSTPEYQSAVSQLFDVAEERDLLRAVADAAQRWYDASDMEELQHAVAGLKAAVKSLGAEEKT